MIVILDDVLTNDECNQLINIYEENKEKTKIHGDPIFYPLDLDLINSDFTTSILKKLEQIAQLGNENVVIDWAQIVKWNPDTYMNPHIDHNSNETVLTSVLYLNDNYEYGSTYFTEGSIIKSKTGRILIFDGKKYEHGVDKILNNYRYTLPIWYKLKI